MCPRRTAERRSLIQSIKLWGSRIGVALMATAVCVAAFLSRFAGTGTVFG